MPHVMDKAVVHLEGSRAFFEVAQVDAADKELATTNFSFKDKPKFAICVPVVNDLDDRVKVGREVIEDHEFGFCYEIPPLPVAMKLGWEF
jgi:hypothetical protein